MKPKVAFLFVEAGLGHVVPMRAVLDVFEQKYGNEVDVIKVSFFNETNDDNMKFVEQQLITEVKKYNKNRFRAKFHFFLMDLIGTRLSMKFLMERRYKPGLIPSLDYLESLNADLIFNTHFATLYYACKLKSKKIIDSDIVTFCPDPHIGRQWDRRGDYITLSSEVGKKEALSQGFKKDQVGIVPFLIRSDVLKFYKGRAFYREELGLPIDNFTILLADGAYGAGKLEKTVLELLKSKSKMTIIAVCGKNEALFERFQAFDIPSNITFTPFSFTDKMLLLSAACDLFIGKAGASNLAEPCYFKAPQIISYCPIPVEKWIAKHHVACGSAIKCFNVKKIRKMVEGFIENPSLLKPYEDACVSGHRTDGPEQLADMLYQRVMSKKKINKIL